MPSIEKEVRKILAEFGCAFTAKARAITKSGSAQSPNAISQSMERSSRATRRMKF
jgi:hypothetical protein